MPHPEKAIPGFLAQGVAAQVLIPLIDSSRSLCFSCTNLEECKRLAQKASAANPERE